MREVVLLQKTYRGICLRKVEKDLGRLCEGLRVRLVVLGAVENGWIKVGVSGEDEKVAVHFLEKEIGLAPISSEKVENFSVMHGRIILSGRDRGGVLVDIGVFLPRPMYAFVSLRRLQEQLIDGKKFALSRIVKMLVRYIGLILVHKPNYSLIVCMD